MSFLVDFFNKVVCNFYAELLLIYGVDYCRPKVSPFPLKVEVFGGEKMSCGNACVFDLSADAYISFWF